MTSTANSMRALAVGSALMVSIGALAGCSDAPPTTTTTRTTTTDTTAPVMPQSTTTTTQRSSVTQQ